MKVNIDITLVVEEPELILLSDVLDGKVSRRKAKRDEVKSYVWLHGESWEENLREEWEAAFGTTTAGNEVEAEDEDGDDDLLGDDSDLDDESLL